MLKKLFAAGYTDERFGIKFAKNCGHLVWRCLAAGHLPSANDHVIIGSDPPHSTAMGSG